MTTGPIAQELRNALSQPNLLAFLQVIRAGEGTADVGGYSRLFGGDQFASFADHPRRVITRTLGAGGKEISSTAAGAYQFLSRTWDECRDALQLPDFSHESQDLAAVYLIRRRGALEDVLAGRIETAIAKCNREWASLPGSPYGQPTRTLTKALATYAQFGGVLASATPQPEKPVIPFIAAALPYLIQAAPSLIRIFGDSPQSEKNAKAAETVAAIAQEVTGQPTVEGAVGELQNNPEAAAKFREKVHLSMGDLIGLVQAVDAMEQKNIAAARTYNTEEGLFLDTRWVKLKFIHLLSLVFVGFSGYFVQKYWGDLTPELRGAVITLMIIAGWNGVRDYWMGSSSGSDRKTSAMIREAKSGD